MFDLVFEWATRGAREPAVFELAEEVQVQGGRALLPAMGAGYP
jgi:hypothetical protein